MWATAKAVIVNNWYIRYNRETIITTTTTCRRDGFFSLPHPRQYKLAFYYYYYYLVAHNIFIIIILYYFIPQTRQKCLPGVVVPMGRGRGKYITHIAHKSVRSVREEDNKRNSSRTHDKTNEHYYYYYCINLRETWEISGYRSSSAETAHVVCGIIFILQYTCECFLCLYYLLHCISEMSIFWATYNLHNVIIILLILIYDVFLSEKTNLKINLVHCPY